MSTDWEDHYRAGDTPWDRGAAAPPLLEWLGEPGHALAGDVLVPGCGLGHDVRAIAARGGSREVVGLDLSASALEQVRRKPRVRSETYVKADLFALPTELLGRFDWIVEHTCFCAIEPARRGDYVQSVRAALREDGHLLAIFYLDPWGAGETRPSGGGPPFGATRSELDALFRGAFDLLEERTPGWTYPGREGRELLRVFRKAQ